MSIRGGFALKALVLVILTAVIGVLTSFVVFGAADAAPKPGHCNRGHPCPSSSPTPPPTTTPPPTVNPIALIVMENHEYSAIVGSSSAPYINQTLIPAGRLFT